MVGCVCAEFLSGDNPQPKLAEQELRNLAARNKTSLTRREKFPFRRWTVVAGNVHWITFEGDRIGVVPDDAGGYRLKINGILGKLTFPTMEEAKLRAFDVVQQRRRRQR